MSGCTPQYGLEISNFPRPFKYGTPFTYEECTTDVKHTFEEFELKKGDIVADIGAGNGYLEGAFAVISDSITFFIQDINKRYLNQEEFEKVTKYYTKLKGRSFTNKHILCMGTRKKTNLPDSMFDKIITNLVFHELKFPNVMIEDIKRKMKHEGKLFISDVFSSNRKTRFALGCNLKAYTVKQVIDIMNKHGLYLHEMIYPENCYGNTLVFVTNKTYARNIYRKNNSADDMVEMLDKISIARDSMLTNSIADSILKFAGQNIDSNKYLGYWIDGEGYGMLRRKEYQSAINLFKANIKIFPEAHTYNSLAEAYKRNKQYELALFYSKRTMELDPYNDSSRKRINKLNQILKIGN